MGEHTTEARGVEGSIPSTPIFNPKMLDKKYSVIFKKIPQDFIVEELGKDYKCSVDDCNILFSDKKIDLSGLINNDKRPFLTCDLEKINVDHLTAISTLSRQIALNNYEIGYAGIKDKRAWTSQRISLFNPDMDKLQSFHYPGICLANFKWAKHKIKIEIGRAHV